VVVAKDLISSLACDICVSGTFEALVGVKGSATLARGVAIPGKFKGFRDGVKGAAVGAIRETVFGMGSSRITGSGWACGNPNPGGTDGVEEREPKAEVLIPCIPTLLSSETRASTSSGDMHSISSRRSKLVSIGGQNLQSE